MKIERCFDDKGQRVTCLACGHTLNLNDAFADRDGEPFKAYYHQGHIPEGNQS